MRRWLHRFAQDRRGAVSVIAAVSCVLILVCAALAVDLGSVFLQSRKLQGAADLAALAAARDLPNATAAAQATAAANALGSNVMVKVVTGVYTPDRTVPAAQRFQANAASPNAARVTVNSKADLFFGAAILGKPQIDISRTATAASAQLASFSIGTRLLSLQGGVANSLLSALTGSQINLSVMDYNQLANTNINLFQYIDALRADLKLVGVSYDTVLNSNVTTGRALKVLSDLLNTNGQDSAALAVRQIANAAGDLIPADLNKIISLGPYAQQDHIAGGSGADIKLSALDMANAILTLSEGGRQVKLTLGANVGGLANVDVWLGIGEPPNNSPWIAITDKNTVVVSTAQTRLYINAQVLPSGSALNGTGAGLINLPIFVEAASGQAKLAAINCTSGSRSATLAVKPSIGQAAIGQIDVTKINDFTKPMTVNPAMLLNLLILQATAQAQVNLGGVTWQNVTFSQADIDAGTIKTVSSNDLLQGVVSSLLSNISLNVSLLGLNIGVGPIVSALGATLAPVAAPLDGVVSALTSLLGVHLGQADVKVNGLRCKDAALVA